MKMFDRTANTIRIIALDMDQCIFHPGYKWLPLCRPSEVIDKNTALLDSIKAKSLHYARTIVFLASSRQTKELDLQFSIKNHTESSFGAIKKIAAYLGAELDDFLLGDLYLDVPPGTSFRNALDAEYTGIHATGPNDYTKCTLLYAQIHKTANQYPQHEISFDFYDDGGFVRFQILDQLYECFSNMPTLLPSNVTLNFFHYEGMEVTFRNCIKGEGFIDIQYPQTVMEITRLSKEKHSNAIKVNSLRLDEQVLYYRKAWKPMCAEETNIDTSGVVKEGSSSMVLTMIAGFSVLLLALIYICASNQRVTIEDRGINYGR